MGKIIGRKKEIDELMDIYRCNESQLVAVYGRRRVGKTFLIRELFKDEFAFYHTGLSPSELLDTNLLNAQLEAFSSSLKRYGYNSANTLKNWMDAFDCLADLLSKADKGSRLVVFIDEMPWLDTPRSGFITAFEHFWNGWGAGQDNLMLIVCGSATSWIQDNLINSYGGLYDRVNAEISLSPFTLHETEQFLQAHEITLTRYDILQLYMAIGGIPMYLSYVQRGLSLAQIIDSLYYSRKAKLKREFDRLFNSIFRQPDNYKKVVLLLSKRQCGYSRNEISEELGIGSGNNLSMILSALEESDFIEYYKPFENNKRNMLYRLIDPFCLFYLSQVEGRRRKENFWSDNENSQSLVVWRGRAFENACLNHIPQIKKALGIAGVAGNGQGELFEAISGEVLQERPDIVRIRGRDTGRSGISARRRLGAAFVPEERLGHGAVPNMSLTDNLLLSRYATDGKVFLGGGLLRLLQQSSLAVAAKRIVAQMDVRKSAENPDASALSGGNLQKFLIGRELDRNPSVLVVNQPTWGVDAGAAAHIRQALVDLARSGSAVIVISQDLDELFEISDRIAAMVHGRLSQSVPIEAMNMERVGLMMGGADTASAHASAGAA